MEHFNKHQWANQTMFLSCIKFFKIIELESESGLKKAPLNSFWQDPEGIPSKRSQKSLNLALGRLNLPIVHTKPLVRPLLNNFPAL